MSTREVLYHWWMWAFHKGAEAGEALAARDLRVDLAIRSEGNCPDCGRELRDDEFCSCPQSRL